MRIERREPISFATPAEAISVIGAKLRSFERVFERRTSEFYAAYKEGMQAPDINSEEWASTYELYLQYLGRVEAFRKIVEEGASQEAPSSVSLALAA